MRNIYIVADRYGQVRELVFTQRRVAERYVESVPKALWRQLTDLERIGRQGLDRVTRAASSDRDYYMRQRNEELARARALIDRGYAAFRAGQPIPTIRTVRAYRTFAEVAQDGHVVAR